MWLAFITVLFCSFCSLFWMSIPTPRHQVTPFSLLDLNMASPDQVTYGQSKLYALLLYTLHKMLKPKDKNCNKLSFNIKGNGRCNNSHWILEIWKSSWVRIDRCFYNENRRYFLIRLQFCSVLSLFIFLQEFLCYYLQSPMKRSLNNIISLMVGNFFKPSICL